MKNSIEYSYIYQALNQRWQNLIRYHTYDNSHNKICTTPPISRQPITPDNWKKSINPCNNNKNVNVLSFIRRSLLLILIIVQTYLATGYLASLLPYQGWSELRIIQDWQINPSLALQNAIPYVLQGVILALFAILFAWISIGFWTAIMGIRVMLFNH